MSVSHNLVFIHIAHLRTDSFSFAGNPAISTPTFDRLAQEGVFFSQCYNPIIYSKEQIKSSPNFLNRIEPFKRASLLLWSSLVTRGYLFYESHFASQPIPDGKVGKTAVYPRIVHEDEEAKKVKEQKEKEMSKWVSFLDKLNGKNFVAHFSSDELVAPFHAEQGYYDQVKTLDIPKRLVKQKVNSDNQVIFGTSIWEENHWHEMRQTYLAQVLKMDKGIASILAHLESHDLLDKSLIVVYGQAAPSLGDYGFEVDPVHPVKEAYNHVPLFIRYPKHIPGAVDKKDKLVSLCDLWPTILETVGLGNHPRNANTRALALVKRDNQDETRVREMIRGKWVLRRFYGEPKIATFLKTKDYFLVNFKTKSELYAHDDPYGLTNLARHKENLPLVKKLRSL